MTHTKITFVPGGAHATTERRLDEDKDTSPGARGGAATRAHRVPGYGVFVSCPACDALHVLGTDELERAGYAHDALEPTLGRIEVGAGDTRCVFSLSGGAFHYLAGSAHGMAGESLPMRPVEFSWPAPPPTAGGEP